MLSSSLRRRKNLNNTLVQSQKLATTEAGESKLMADPAAPPEIFKSAANVLINGSTVSILMPQKFSGVMWDTWSNVTVSYDNNQNGFDEFSKSIAQASADIDKRIDIYDDNVALLQTLTSTGAVVIQTLQLIMAANQTNSDSLSDGSYKNYQVSLSAVLSGLSFLASFISTRVATQKKAAIAAQTAIIELEDSQEVTKAPAGPLVSVPLSASAIEITARAPASSASVHTSLMRATIEAAPSDGEIPDNFVPVGNAMVFTSSIVNVTLPTRTTGCALKSWTLDTNVFPLSIEGFASFKGTLFARKNDLDSAVTDYDNDITLIQDCTSLGTTIISAVQTAVVAAQNSSLNLQIFQIVISATNGVLAAAAKLASSRITTLRNNVLTFSGNTADILTAQITPAPSPRR